MTKDNFGHLDIVDQGIQKTFHTANEAYNYLLVRRMGITLCLKCGKNQIYDNNPVCIACIKEIKSKDINWLVEKAINEFIEKESSK